MLSRRDQYEVLQNIRFKNNETKRIDCPFCGGKYTLTVTVNDGSLIWNCYKASCDARGGKRVGYSIEDIKNGSFVTKTEIRKRSRDLPTILANLENHEHVLQYIDRFDGLSDVIKQSPTRFKYDPAQDRLLFMMNDNQGAVGRTLKHGVKPKWLAYGNTQGIYSIGQGTTAVVVEDAISACIVSKLTDVTGVALLGTNMSPQQKKQLRLYKNVIFCLDNDASKKSLSLIEKLQGWVPHVSVRFLWQDIKDMRLTKIEEMLYDESERNCSHRL
jgi:hypothetical protein